MRQQRYNGHKNKAGDSGHKTQPEQGRRQRPQDPARLRSLSAKNLLFWQGTCRTSALLYLTHGPRHNWLYIGAVIVCMCVCVVCACSCA